MDSNQDSLLLTTMCSVTFTDYVMDAFSKHSQFEVIHTDFLKAFDCVNNSSLLKVLIFSGFGEPSLSWLRYFVSYKK